MAHRRSSPVSTMPFGRLIALLLALVMVAAACGGGDDDGGGGDTDAAVDEESGEPVKGGRLVYGLEADTQSPWTPQNAVCAISCHMVMRSVFDPLLLPDEDGVPSPNLAASAEPNDDYTVWTITVREGITFHDGTPLDGAAVAENLIRHQKSFLTGNALSDVKGTAEAEFADTGVSAEGMTVTVEMDKPWVSFDVYLTGQIGYMASPAWLNAIDAGTAEAAHPVGTGPFVFKEYRPGDRFIATKNAEYWREGLPHLDEVEFRMIPDVKARSNALQSGQINAMHTSNGEEIALWRDRGGFKLLEDTLYGETDYILLNVGDPESPFSDQRVRCGLAHATNSEELVQLRSAGVGDVANGPFSNDPEDRMGFLEDSGYPEFDLDEAKRIIEEWEAENGPLRVSYETTSDPFNLRTAEVIKSMWEAAGAEVSINQFEQGVFILEALQGNFQAFGWRLHSGRDPDAQHVWWTSENAVEPPGLALNFGRIRDDVIDENLDIIRTNPDEDARREAAEAINERFGEQCYNLWTRWTVWGIIADESVKNLTGLELPDGGMTQPTSVGIGGTHQITQIFIDES